MKTESEAVDMIPARTDGYSDENQLIDEFCKRYGCIECDGADQNSEPNDYGCELMEKWVEKWECLVIHDND